MDHTTRDRRFNESVADWVRPIPWQLFVHLTFPWNVRSETADSKFREFVNDLEKTLKTRVCFIAGKEGRSKNGPTVPFHFHVAMTAAITIPLDLVKTTWRNLIGRSNASELKDDSVRVDPWCSHADGLSYLLKQISDADSSWDCNWIGLFHPGPLYSPDWKNERQRKTKRWHYQPVKTIKVPVSLSIVELAPLTVTFPTTLCLDTLDNFPEVIEEVTDPITIADGNIEATSLPTEFIHRELLRLIDSNEMEAEEERTAIAQQTAKALAQNPKAMDSILATAASRLSAVAGSRVGYDPQVNWKSYRATVDKMEAATDMPELVTGFPVFDSLMGGIPKEAVMGSMPGKPHHGKSIVIDNLIVGMLENNPDLTVFLHHVDDAALMRIPRILGVMSGLSSRSISKAGASLLGPMAAEFEERYRKAEEKLNRWIEEERLVLADQSVLVNTLPAHEQWIRDIRRRNSKGHFVSVGDNFHLFDLPGMDPGEGKVREMSRFISTLPTKHGITTLFTMELPKENLRAGVRPKYTDAKNSGGISFDSKLNIGVYQELQDLGDECVLSWTSSNHMDQVTNPDGTTSMKEKKLPIVEMIIDKNKVTGEKKTIFYRLEPMSGRMEECSEMEQTTMAMSLEAAKHNNRRFTYPN
ncbi:hypothetical protein [Granulicella arctica]|uniref:hypothetical protein n=1 Tax=Granulicella arctica TaxID=940613 RepID=UPI0021E008DB|nr:hypothetical protein [Granulicella arctica]